MTVHTDRKLELLKLIAANPGIDAGLLMSRSTTCRKASELSAAIQGLMVADCLVESRPDEGEQLTYYLTERGAGAAEEYGFDVAEADPAGANQVPDTDEIPSTTEEVAAVFEELPVITAGAGEVVLEQESEPLPVIDSDRTSLETALDEVRQLTAEKQKPVNFDDCLTFLREFARCVQGRHPAVAAMLNCSANLLERVYQPAQ